MPKRYLRMPDGTLVEYVGGSGDDNEIKQSIEELAAQLTDKVGAAELTTTVQDALAEAKESGEFDGEPGIGVKEIRLKGKDEDEDIYEIVLDDDRVYTFAVKQGKSPVLTLGTFEENPFESGRSGVLVTATNADGSVYEQRVYNGVDSGVQVDDTLSRAGYAADAKETGGRLDNLSNAIDDKADKAGWSPDKFIGTDAEGYLVEKDVPAGGGTGAHYAMATIASGTITPTAETEGDTDVNLSFMIPEATVEKLRTYKAIIVQVSSTENINSSGNVYFHFNVSTGGASYRNTFARMRYGLKSHKIMLMFADSEHYVGLVLAQSDSNTSDISYPDHSSSTTGRVSFGYIDMSGISSEKCIEFTASNATVGNPISYKVIGLSEEAANFT